MTSRNLCACKLDATPDSLQQANTSPLPYLEYIVQFEESERAQAVDVLKPYECHTLQLVPYSVVRMRPEQEQLFLAAMEQSPSLQYRKSLLVHALPQTASSTGAAIVPVDEGGTP